MSQTRVYVYEIHNMFTIPPLYIKRNFLVKN